MNTDPTNTAKGIYDAIEQNKITTHTEQRATWLANWILGLTESAPIVDIDVTAKEASLVCSYVRANLSGDTLSSTTNTRLLTIERQSKKPETTKY